VYYLFPSTFTMDVSITVDIIFKNHYMCIVKYCISMISHDIIFGKIRATPQKEILRAHAHLLKRLRATWSEKGW